MSEGLCMWNSPECDFPCLLSKRDILPRVTIFQVVKNEVNVPVLKNFVEMLYSATLDMANKKKHSLVSTIRHTY